MLNEQYTPDAICNAMGLPAFIDQGLPSPTLRLLLMPSFDPEVCITLIGASEGGASESARLSVIALAESLYQQPAPCRMPAWKEQVEVSASVFADISEDFAAAVAAEREATGRMVCIDGMPVDGCHIMGTRVERIAGHPYRPAVSRFVSRLIRMAWEACSGAGVRNGLANCGRYVGENLPREALPPITDRSRVLILGTSEDRGDLLEQLGSRGEPV